MSPRYFEDFAVGERFLTGGVTVSESMILDFALRYDPQPFHIDAEAAKETAFGGLIASGFHTLALGFRMLVQHGIFDAGSMGSPGFDELRWLLPVRPGDTLRSELEVTEAAPSRSKPDRGMVRTAVRILNQRSEAVLSYKGMHIIARRPG